MPIHLESIRYMTNPVFLAEVSILGTYMDFFSIPLQFDVPNFPIIKKTDGNLQISNTIQHYISELYF